MKGLTGKIFLFGMLFLFGLVGFYITNVQANPNNSLAELTAYTMHQASSSLTSADFNGDTMEDMVVVGKKGGSFSILFGKGDGTFYDPVPLDICGKPSFLVAKDFNGDGTMDLAAITEMEEETGYTGEEESSSICLILGLGDGTFQEPVYTKIGGEAHFLVAADFNMDNLMDLALTTEYENADGEEANYICIFLGSGDGNFNEPTHMEIHGEAKSLAASDFNMDGMKDLAASVEKEKGEETGDGDGGNGCICVLLGRGDGTFNEPIHMEGKEFYSLIATDFNMDGMKDLAAIEAGSENICVFMGKGDGTFMDPVCVTVEKKLFSILAEDFNGDGKMDLAATDKKDGKVFIILGKGDGTFEEPVPYKAGEKPSAIISADFNGDGKKDLAVSDKKSGMVSILIGQGDGTFTLVNQ